MKLLWHSNSPWSQSGYGNQTELFAARLKHTLGHDVVISSFWGLAGAKLEWDGIDVWPCAAGYGSEDIPVFAAHMGDGDPLAVTPITLMDVWALDPRHLAGLAMASWVPVDHHELQPLIRQFFQVSGAVPIAMSQHGVREIQDAGFDPLYVPHGVDTGKLRPIPKDQAREALGIPQDAFLVGMVAANQGSHPPRKGFPQAFEAFRDFRKTHSDALLYLHTFLDKDEGPGRRNGIDLHELIRHFGIGDAVGATPEMAMRLGITTEQMAVMYSCFDVLLAPSYGEGFGIPIVEAQACGVPVIVNDFSAMSELCGSGWLIQGEPYFNYSHGAGPCYWQAPSVKSITEMLEHAYDEAAGMRDQAREFAAAYDVDRVLFDYWVPTLAELDVRLAEKRERSRSALAERLGAVKPNRAQRRAAKKALAA